MFWLCPSATPGRPGVAPVHPDHRPAARKVNHRTGSRDRAASDTGRRRRACRGGAVDHRTGGRPRVLRGRGGLVRRARRRPLGGVDPLRRNCPPTGAPPSRARAAASSPSPIPTTKSPRPQRSSETIMSALGVRAMTTSDPPRPARRRGRADRDGARTGRIRARRRPVHRHRNPDAHSAFR